MRDSVNYLKKGSKPKKTKKEKDRFSQKAPVFLTIYPSLPCEKRGDQQMVPSFFFTQRVQRKYPERRMKMKNSDQFVLSVISLAFALKKLVESDYYDEHR